MSHRNFHKDCTFWSNSFDVHEVAFVTNTLNPFPHIVAFWRLCSRRHFENIVTKEEVAQNKQFLLLPQCFPLLFNYKDFLIFWQNMFKVICCRIVVWGKEHFLSYSRFLRHLQRTFFKTFEAKESIVHNEQFLLLPQCFQLCSIFNIYSHFCLNIFKVVYWRFAVCWKGLNLSQIHYICSRWLWKW